MCARDASPCRRALLWFIPLSFFVVLSAAGPAEARQETQASIIGQAKDQSGAVLPGVTVTATSPSLQVQSVTAVTNVLGEYRLTPLPIGTYRVVYELPGFQTIQREGLRLTAGFVAKQDVVLNVGGVAESVTVTGAGNVVDTTSTTTATNFTAETLAVLPGARNSLTGVLSQAPGVRTNFDVGGDQFGIMPEARVFAQPAEGWYKIEGVATTALTQGGGVAQYFDYNTFEEARVETLAMDAEATTRGVQLNTILKSGSNNFHGGASGSFTNHSLQSTNVDAGLAAQGITRGNPIIRRDDASAELGGRIIRDKLWFYGALRRQENIQEFIGSFQPDGSPALRSYWMNWNTEKLSYQMNGSNRFIGFVTSNAKSFVDPGGPTIAWETRGIQQGYTRVAKAEWQATHGNSLVFSLLAGYWRFYSINPNTTDAVGTHDIFTLVDTGERVKASEGARYARKQGSATLSWYRPNWFYGNHTFKAGLDYYANSAKAANPGTTPAQPAQANNYRLYLNNGVPYQIQAFDYPTSPLQVTNFTAVYAKDSWTMGRRLTLDLGIRYTHDDPLVPASCRDAARPPGDVIFPAACHPTVQMAIYNSVSPRLSVAYDVSGDGKTVLKGGWGRFAAVRSLDEVTQLDPYAENYAMYRWHDLNGDKLYEPGEVNLDPNGPDYVSRALTANAVPNPNQKDPHTDEFSISLERGLTSNVAVRITGLYSRSGSLRLQNNLRPYSAYSIPVTRPDPGPDGKVGTTDDPGTTLTYYEFSPALAGVKFEQFMLVNDPRAERTYKSFELSAFKRLAKRWQFMVSYSMTKRNVPFEAGAVGGAAPEVLAADLNPNAEINTADHNWEWLAKASGAYVLPADITVSANFEQRSGYPFARQVLLTGGKTIPSILVNAEPIGTRRLPNLNMLNLRGEKKFAVKGSHTIALRAILYNVLNTNAVGPSGLSTAMTIQSGPRFLVPTTITPPRIVEFGVTYAF
jgi:hypothetical protein